MKTHLETGDRITIDFCRGGYRAGIRINEGTDHLIQSAVLELRPSEPTVLTIAFGVESLPNQIGYFVDEPDMAAFMAWKLQTILPKCDTST